ncbi:MAG: transcriptional regulator [Thermoplasmata archaeon]|nr:transcriptional regulator [Thermoplasmata archaeon]
MEKERMLKEIRAILRKSGFEIGEPIFKSISFDIIAKRDELVLILKSLINIDALRNEVARELKILGKELNASPLIIGEKSALGPILDGVIYSRHGIPIVSLGTFRDFILENINPLVYASPGGLYVKLNGELLRKMREERGISLGHLARIAGVSRKAIQLYEEGMSAVVDIALKLEEYLGEELIQPLDILSFEKLDEERYPLEMIRGRSQELEEIYRKLMSIGYEVYLTLKCPFEALSKDESDVFLTGITRDNTSIRYKALNFRILRRILEKDAFIVVNHIKREEIEGIPLIGKDELMEIERREEIKKIVRERSAI